MLLTIVVLSVLAADAPADEAKAQPVTVVGWMGKTFELPWTEGLTLFRVILSKGGISEPGGPVGVEIWRKDGNQTPQRAAKYRMKTLLDKWFRDDSWTDPALQPGDRVVFLPRPSFRF